MKEIYSTLSQLQDVLAKMFEIEDKIKEIPKALADKEAVLEKTKLTYLELHEKSEKIKEDLKNIRVKLDEATNKRETCEKMVETITQQREFDTLRKEIDDATAAEQNLRKNLLTKEKYFEELNLKLTLQEDIMAHESEEVKEETAVKDALIAEQEAELAKVKAERDELAKDMDKNILFKFERIIRNKGGVGIVPIHGNVCQGCHMILPAQFVNDVRREDEIDFCPYCSRVLFYENVEDAEQFDIMGDSSDEGEESEEFRDEFSEGISDEDFGL